MRPRVPAPVRDTRANRLRRTFARKARAGAERAYDLTDGAARRIVGGLDRTPCDVAGSFR